MLDFPTAEGTSATNRSISTVVTFYSTPRRVLLFCFLLLWCGSDRLTSVATRLPDVEFVSERSYCTKNKKHENKSYDHNLKS